MFDAHLPTQAILGLAAVGLSIVAFLPYIVDVLRGRTRPQRTTWTIWSVLAAISASAQFASGNSHAMGFAFVQAGAALLIAILAVALGTQQRFTRLDLITLAGAAFGIMLWYASDTPGFALIICVSLGLLGAIPTLVKTFANPESETLSTWVLLLISSLLAVCAVNWTDPIMLVYPAYLALLRAAILMAFAAGKLWRSIGAVAAMPRSASPVVA